MTRTPPAPESHHPGAVLFVTGPSGAGKSTAALAWASSRPLPCALIDHDHIRHFIKSGFADPGLGWDARAQRQWELARSICCDLARRYTAAGIDCVLDAFSPVPDFQDWAAGLDGIVLRVAVLLPPLDIVLMRNAQRVGEARLSEQSVRENYGWMEGWRRVPTALVIDNSDMSVDEVVRQLGRLLRPVW